MLTYINWTGFIMYKCILLGTECDFDNFNSGERRKFIEVGKKLLKFV